MIGHVGRLRGRGVGRPRGSRALEIGVALVLLACIAALVPFALEPRADFAAAAAAGVVLGVIAVLAVRLGATVFAAVWVIALTAFTVMVLKTNHDRSHVTHLFPWSAVLIATLAALAAILRSRSSPGVSERSSSNSWWSLAPALLFGVVEALALFACRVPPS